MRQWSPRRPEAGRYACGDTGLAASVSQTAGRGRPGSGDAARTTTGARRRTATRPARLRAGSVALSGVGLRRLTSAAVGGVAVGDPADGATVHKLVADPANRLHPYLDAGVA